MRSTRSAMWTMCRCRMILVGGRLTWPYTATSLSRVAYISGQASCFCGVHTISITFGPNSSCFLTNTLLNRSLRSTNKSYKTIDRSLLIAGPAAIKTTFNTLSLGRVFMPTLQHRTGHHTILPRCIPPCSCVRPTTLGFRQGPPIPPPHFLTQPGATQMHAPQPQHYVNTDTVHGVYSIFPLFLLNVFFMFCMSCTISPSACCFTCLHSHPCTICVLHLRTICALHPCTICMLHPRTICASHPCTVCTSYPVGVSSCTPT